MSEAEEQTSFKSQVCSVGPPLLRNSTNLVCLHNNQKKRICPFFFVNDHYTVSIFNLCETNRPSPLTFLMVGRQKAFPLGFFPSFQVGTVGFREGVPPNQKKLQPQES